MKKKNAQKTAKYASGVTAPSTLAKKKKKNASFMSPKIGDGAIGSKTREDGVYKGLILYPPGDPINANPPGIN